jgi:ribosomal protein S27AE
MEVLAMQELDTELDIENAETCPNCGAFIGNGSTCSNCGVVLFEDGELNLFDDEGDVD